MYANGSFNYCSTVSPKVISAGPSMAPAIDLEIMVPNSFAPRDEKLFNILDIQVCLFCFTMILHSPLYVVHESTESDGVQQCLKRHI